MNTGTDKSILLKKKKHSGVLTILCFIILISSFQAHAFDWRSQTCALLATLTKSNIAFVTKNAIKIGVILGGAYWITHTALKHQVKDTKTKTYDLGNPVTGLKLIVDTDARVEVIGHDKNTIKIEHQYGASRRSEFEKITCSNDDYDENTKQIKVRGLINTCTPSRWQNLLSWFFRYKPKRKLIHRIYVPHTTNVEIVTSASADYSHNRYQPVTVSDIVGNIDATTHHGGVIVRKTGNSTYYDPKPQDPTDPNSPMKPRPAQLHNQIKITAPKAFGAGSVYARKFPGTLRIDAPVETIKYLRHRSNYGYSTHYEQPPRWGKYTYELDQLNIAAEKFESNASPTTDGVYLGRSEIQRYLDNGRINIKDVKKQGKLAGAVFVNRPADYTEIFETKLSAEYFESNEETRERRLTAEAIAILNKNPESFHIEYPCVQPKPKTLEEKK